MSVKRLHHRDDEEQDNSWHSVALWIENSQVLLPWLMPMLAGGFAAGLIWIGFNKIMLNKLMTIRGIYEGADSGNSSCLRRQREQKRNKVMTLCAQR